MPSQQIPPPLAGEARPMTSAREFRRALTYLLVEDSVTYAGVTVQRLPAGYRLIDRSGTVHKWAGKHLPSQHAKLIQYLIAAKILPQ